MSITAENALRYILGDLIDCKKIIIGSGDGLTPSSNKPIQS